MNSLMVYLISFNISFSMFKRRVDSKLECDWIIVELNMIGTWEFGQNLHNFDSKWSTVN